MKRSVSRQLPEHILSLLPRQFQSRPKHTFNSKFSLSLQSIELSSRTYMGSLLAGKNSVDLWSEIIEEDEVTELAQVFYTRKKRTQQPRNECAVAVDPKQRGLQNRKFGAPEKRISWNRSLSIRGRVSIAVAAFSNLQPQQKQPKRKGRPPIPTGKVVQHPNFEKEKEYFQEVDDFELLEESPSPKNFGTWATGDQSDSIAIPYLSSKLEKWLISKQLNYNCEPSTTLSKVLETPGSVLDPISIDDYDSPDLKTPEKSLPQVDFGVHSVLNRFTSSIIRKDGLVRDINTVKRTELTINTNQTHEDIDDVVRKLSLASTSLEHDELEPFCALLTACEQSAPSTLGDVFSKYCDLGDIVKIGEGTYGEAFKAGNNVCKIVPIDGDLQVNGELQKRSEELLEEVILSRTLNQLRGHKTDAYSSCTTFIDTKDLKVCQGPYDPSLVRAWEDWDEKHGSENDHPKAFPKKQCYVVFVLEHGGKDLESFVLFNYDEARSLLVQVTAALAVAEAAYEFEHRDLHWGNVLLSRNNSSTSKFTLEGKSIEVRSFGLSVSIIDFTLSRINTGEDVLFLDLSLDPDLFKGPKGDKQFDTYRKMKDITKDQWGGSFPRTNVLWLLYLVDTILMKKSFERSSRNERDLRSLKKRMDKYKSARETVFDPFFTELFVDSS